MMISSDGTVIRMDAGGISTMGRSTSGVKVMRLDDDIKIAAIAKVSSTDDDEDEMTLLDQPEV